jgi:HK97 family phage prohead protease
MQKRSMETRVVRTQSQVRAKQSGNIVFGRGITFNTLSHDLGGFREKFSGRKLTIDPSFRLLWNHDTGAPLASIASGLKLDQRIDGLYYSAPLPATTLAADVKTLIQDEIASEVSFGFIVDSSASAEEWSRINGEVIRTVHTATIFEISILGAQASYAANTIDVRSVERQLAKFALVNTEVDQLSFQQRAALIDSLARRVQPLD